MRRSLFKSPPIRGGRDRRLRFTKRTTAAALGGIASLATAGAIVASAAVVPTFPDNVVVFPDRDFVTIEGYQDHVGETGTVTVTRNGQIIGSAQGTVEEGDVAFEVNHPGGYCWGAGTNLKVTPDIRPGDVVQISFPGVQNAGDTTVADAFVTGDAVQDGNKVTVTGHVGAAVNQNQMEQRIVEPALVDTAVAKRDVRAAPGPMTPAAKGGYSSSLEFPTPDTFVATYLFDADLNPATAPTADDLQTAKIAANASLGERAMAWQVEDADANRQQLTIAEFGEPGGPGMGGCPAGPADSNPTPGTYSAVRSGTSIQVNWTPATDIPTAEPVTGYSVVAIGPAGTNGEQNVIGKRVSKDADPLRTTLTVEAGVDYTIEVRSIAGGKMGVAFDKTNGTTPTEPGDTTPPIVTATQADTGAVTLGTNEPGADVYYTTSTGPVDPADSTQGFTPVIEGGLPTDAAKLYTAPIAITQADTRINAIAIDAAGNTSDTARGTFSPQAAPALPLPVAPTLTGTAGQTQVSLKWNVSPAAEKVTGYQVTVYNADGTKAAAGLQPAETVDAQQTVTGLTAGTDYGFTVKARNATGFGNESTKITLKPTAVTDRVTITTAKWKTGDFRVVGTSSAASGTVKVYRANADGTKGAQIGTLVATLTAAAPPATGSTYDWRLRTGVPTTNPGRIVVESSNGGVSAPVTPSNG